ncbi:MAG TPA: hypothetical protein VFB78_13840 [Acidimicrobiales bacterium]|nr:hypothetical protein [Acidimicrobiales bacterium]
MRRIATPAVLLAASTLFWMASAPMASAANAVCDEPNGMQVNGPVSGNVTVPANGVCHINGHAIGGSVFVGQNAKLFIRTGTTVGGSVIASQSQQLNIENGSRINGSLRATGPGGGFGGFACGVVIGGSVTLDSLTSGSWIIGEPTVPYADDPVPVYGNLNDPDLNCQSPNTIAGSVTFSNNSVARLKLKANTIGNPGGSAIINGNTVINEIIRVEGNTINGSLMCSGNNWINGTPEVTAGAVPNTISGARTGQCSAAFGF